MFAWLGAKCLQDELFHSHKLSGDRLCRSQLSVKVL